MCAERSRRPGRRAQRGLSLVEVMVGLVIALLVSLAASNSARVFTASQRAGMASGGAGANVATTLSAIKSDVASAGLGFYGDSAVVGDTRFMCHKLSFSIETTLRFDGANFTPVKVTRVGANDTLEVMYASEVDAGALLYLEGPSDGTAAALRSLMPVTANQAVVLVPDPLTKLGQTCLIRTVTASAAPTETTRQQLAFANTGTYNKVAFTVAPTFADRDRISLLGTLRWMRYRLDGTDLKVDQLIGGQSGVLARNVMSFRVQYGVSADPAQTTLSSWVNANTTPWSTLSGTDVDRVRALRLGIVVRSAQKEKADPASGECTASTAKPRDPLDSTVEVTPDVTDWKCYRYRSAVAVVPLRNMAW